MNAIHTITPDADLSRHNIEAEQQLLGAILVNNGVYHAVAGLIGKEHFYDPVHADIFALAGQRIHRDQLVSPVTMKMELEFHDGLKELGGPAYLARLAGAAISSFAAPDYARMVFEAWQSRQLEAGIDKARTALAGADGVAMARAQLEGLIAALPQSDGRPNSVSLMSAMIAAVESINAAYQGDSPAIRTGLESLDDLLGGGLWPGDYVILGGRPSMGKTALALNIARRVAAQDIPTVIVSLEMTEESLAQRFMADEASVAYTEARKGNLTETEFRRVIDRVKKLEAYPITILPQHVRDIVGIRAGIKREHARWAAMDGAVGRLGGLGLIIVDYLQLVRVPGTSRYEQVSEASMQLQAIAKTLNVPVIALAQVNRGVEGRDNRRPTLSDLKDSGQIEQDADTVMFCYRDHYYLERDKPDLADEDEYADWAAAVAESRNKIEVTIAKQRQGAIGSVKLGCHLPHNRFWDLGTEDPAEGFA